ncbi:hypothetical protein RJ640_016732 [Escallonia rubra]|uniref:Uncharacterized protein n=1 Tax=Escallonia rubra TaxID=112253 RepID=A0AA88R813_9ASTE|nr:hypothetical protein RJ640_016732 [Escallonia rubra]
MLKDKAAEDPRSVSSPRRVLSFSKNRRATVSFPDSDEKASKFRPSRDHGPNPSEVYGFVGAISTVVVTGSDRKAVGECSFVEDFVVGDGAGEPVMMNKQTDKNIKDNNPPLSSDTCPPLHTNCWTTQTSVTPNPKPEATAQSPRPSHTSHHFTFSREPPALATVNRHQK